MEPDKTAPQGKIPAAPLLICLLLVVATLAVYWPVIHCDFLNYDDPDYFTSNTRVLTGLHTGQRRLGVYDRGTQATGIRSRGCR